jgi:hypothetical protein
MLHGFFLPAEKSFAKALTEPQFESQTATVFFQKDIVQPTVSTSKTPLPRCLSLQVTGFLPPTIDRKKCARLVPNAVVNDTFYLLLSLEWG